jgi:hypothetical protein
MSATHWSQDEKAAQPTSCHYTGRLSGKVVRASDNHPLVGALVTAEEMASGDKHQSESDDRGDFCIEGLLTGRLFEVKVEKRRFKPIFKAVFLSGDREICSIPVPC